MSFVELLSLLSTASEFYSEFLQETMLNESKTVIVSSTFFIVFNFYPTEPSKLISNNFCASTANSMGSLFKTSLLNPFTIRAMAFSVSIPL